MLARTFSPSFCARSIRASSSSAFRPIFFAGGFDVIKLRPECWLRARFAAARQALRTVYFLRCAYAKCICPDILTRPCTARSALRFSHRTPADKSGEVPIPSAPASISFRTSSRISSSCSGVGCLSSYPITYSRIVVAPMNDATLHDTPRFSRYCRYSASVFPVGCRIDVGLLANFVLAHPIVHRPHRFAFAP